MTTIEHWTQEQIEAYAKEHPQAARAKPWIVMDGSLVWGHYDTEEEAKKEVAEIDRDEKIATRFSEWMLAIEDEFSVDHETLKEIIEGEL